MEEKLSFQEEEGDVKEKLTALLQENDSLRTEITQMKDFGAAQENCFPALGIPSNIQEKISDLEGLLRSEDRSSDQTPDGSNAPNADIEGVYRDINQTAVTMSWLIDICIYR